MNKLKFDNRRNRVKYCPCGKTNKDGKFAPFQGYEDKGFCHSCGVNFPLDGKTVIEQHKPEPPKEPSYHNPELLKISLDRSEQNNFIEFLLTLFSIDEVLKAVNKYKIGTSVNWNGATIFWQIDDKQNIRHGKIMLYDSNRGKRKKENGKAFISSVRSVLKLTDFELQQCLFGLHLVDLNNTKIVALVESEKTAILMSIFKPDLIWLATGSKQGFKYQMLRPLRNIKIIAFPDKSELETWQNKANELNKLGFNISVNDWIEGQTEFEKGSDFADILIQELIKDKELKQPQAIIKKDLNNTTLTLEEIEIYFQNLEIPNKPFKMGLHSTITDLPQFIQSNLRSAKNYQYNNLSKPYLNRLIELKSEIQRQQSNNI